MALLFTFIPFLGWVSDAIVSLVTLRKGAKEGALILLWVLLPAVILALNGYSQLWLYDILGGSLLTYGLAVLLRHTRSWTALLEMGALVGIISVFIIHAMVPAVSTAWLHQLTVFLGMMEKQLSWNSTPEQLKSLALELSKVATGIQVSLLLVTDLFSVFFGRWWQALLYNPQGLKQELYNIRLGLVATFLLLVLVLGSMAGLAPAIDSLPIAVLPFILAGISLVQCLFNTHKIAKKWLIVFYGLLIILPYLMALLVLLAAVDAWLDLRQKFKFTTR